MCLCAARSIARILQMESKKALDLEINLIQGRESRESFNETHLLHHGVCAVRSCLVIDDGKNG